MRASGGCAHVLQLCEVDALQNDAEDEAGLASQVAPEASVLLRRSLAQSPLCITQWQCQPA